MGKKEGYKRCHARASNANAIFCFESTAETTFINFGGNDDSRCLYDFRNSGPTVFVNATNAPRSFEVISRLIQPFEYQKEDDTVPAAISSKLLSGDTVSSASLPYKKTNQASTSDKTVCCLPAAASNGSNVPINSGVSSIDRSGGATGTISLIDSKEVNVQHQSFREDNGDQDSGNGQSFSVQ
uniref:Uncharacterized protein n=1 Tax=Panagrolaimus davidi TaxID=227884 RepID=A0A914QTI5_9BILA